MDVRIRKRANMLEISPASQLLYLLDKELKFNRVKPVFGPKKRGAPKVDIQLVSLYRLDEPNDRLYTFAGMLTRVLEKLKDNHFVVHVEDMDQDLVKFEPQWEQIRGIQLRAAQEKMLAMIVSCDRAQLNGVTAIGKSFLIKTCCRLYPQEDCHIVVAAPSRPIVDALHRDLCDMFPYEVGKCGSGQNDPKRITVSTSKSLLKCRPDKTAILFFDEVHSAGAENVSQDLIQFNKARMYGFSASTECRTDRADRMVEALFGPVRVKVSYQDAMNEGVVPMIDTHFYRVAIAPCHSENQVYRKRVTIWNNPSWNAAIAQAAKYWIARLGDPQVLILTDTVEHVMRLLQVLPDFVPFYAGIDAPQLEWLKNKGLVAQSWKPKTPSQLADARVQLENGMIRRAVSTTTLGTGVDFRNLDVLIRADGGSSEVTNIQFRGRVTRGNSGTYIDFMAFGDEISERKALTRFNSCKRAGWKPVEESLPE
jgi:superfamily II DNA or RNA helicase